jgi:DDE_Tnp_1-associated
MSQIKAERLFERIKEIADPRREHQKFHSLFEILVIAICAVLCGAEHWTEREDQAGMVSELFRVKARHPLARHVSESFYVVG